jgi:inhibitor of KinA sporulation pathway (predicted exonuclease)
MKYIILDLEATCWENNPQKNINEIIEIGAVCINEHKVIESEFNAFVKPILHSQLSSFCKQLTSITQADVDAAETFDKVVARFTTWIDLNNEYILCSWGFYDKNQFIADCNLHKINTDWLIHHISLKHQYTVIKNLKKHVGMSASLKIEELKLEGTHHRGIDDAKNIAKIFLKKFEDWKI